MNALSLLVGLLGKEQAHLVLDSVHEEESQALVTSTLSLADLRLLRLSLVTCISLIQKVETLDPSSPQDTGSAFLLERRVRDARRLEELLKLILSGIQKGEEEMKKRAR